MELNVYKDASEEMLAANDAIYLETIDMVQNTILPMFLNKIENDTSREEIMYIGEGGVIFLSEGENFTGPLHEVDVKFFHMIALQQIFKDMGFDVYYHEESCDYPKWWVNVSLAKMKKPEQSANL